MDAVIRISATSPFHVFPEEVWEYILDETNYMQDILQVMRAFPEMNEIFPSKHFTWFFGKILPHIYPKYLPVTDYKNLRMVSWRWKQSMDSFLEMHPDRRPYESCPDIALPETHFNYAKLPYIATEFPSSTSHKMDKFMRFITGCRTENPFPGRSVLIHICDDYKHKHKQAAKDSITDGRHEQCKEQQILQRVGHHIWHVTFEFPCSTFSVVDDILPFKVVQKLFQYISFMPCLKSIKIMGRGSKMYRVTWNIVSQSAEYIESIKSESPIVLPHLETLELCVDFDLSENSIAVDMYGLLMTSLVKHDKVRKVSTYGHYWKKEYAVLFPNMSELIVLDYNRASLKTMLKSLRSTALKKLQIPTRSHPMYIGDVLDLLVPYQVETLQLEGFRMWEGSDQSRYTAASLIERIALKLKSAMQPDIPVPSIRHLIIAPHSRLIYQFVDRLTSVQFITMLTNESWSTVTPLTVIEKTQRSPRRDCIRNLYYRSLLSRDGVEDFKFIWSLSQTLKMVTLNVDFHTSKRRSCFQYSRELKHMIFHSSSPRHYTLRRSPVFRRRPTLCLN